MVQLPRHLQRPRDAIKVADLGRYCPGPSRIELYATYYLCSDRIATDINIEKEWIDCVQSDIRAFGIAGDWKATALEAEVWVETVTEGGRRIVAAWRKEEENAARQRQEKREATRLENLLSNTEAYNFAKRHPLT